MELDGKQNHSSVSNTRALEFLEVKYISIVQSIPGRPMAIEAGSLS
jgi:hypothetical protein